MKTKQRITWSNEQLQSVLAEAVKLRAQNPAITLRMMFNGAQKVLPENLHRVFYQNGLNKLSKRLAEYEAGAMQPAAERQTTLKAHANGHGNAVPDYAALDDAVMKTYQRFNKAGQLWQAVKNGAPDLWAVIQANGGVKSATYRLSKLKKQGAFKKSRKSVAPAFDIRQPAPEPEQPAAVLHYCPNCAFPIGQLIQAVNAVNKIKRGGG